MARSARYTVEETLGMVIDDGLGELDSGGEDEIEEDPEFPLPRDSDEESSSSSGTEDPRSSSSEEGIQVATKTKSKQYSNK